MFLAMTATSHTRKLPKWVARSHIFVIAAGVILFLSSYPIAYLAVASNYTQSIEHVEEDVALYAIIIMIIGVLLGIIKTLSIRAMTRFAQ